MNGVVFCSVEAIAYEEKEHGKRQQSAYRRKTGVGEPSTHDIRGRAG